MAERIIANLTLDTYQRNKIPPLVIPQHDYGARYIRVRITEQGENVSVASGSVVSIIAKRMADGQSAAFSGSVNADGSVLVPVTQWMLDAPSDDVDCHVAVTGTGYQYSTTSFVISPQERENPSYLEEDDPRVNIVEEALIKVVEEADRAEEQADLAQSAASTAASDAKEAARQEVEQLVGQLGIVQTLGHSRMAVVSQEVTTGLYNRNAKRIANLEQGFNEQFETDSSVAYVKNVPEGALPYAEVKKVGGMTRKCANLWDEEWYIASLIEATGEFYETPDGYVCSKNYTAVLPNTKYYKNTGCWVAFYGKNKEFISAISFGAGVFTTPSNCYFLKFQTFNYDYGLVYKNDIIIAEGSTALPYEPYFEGLRSAKVTEVESVGVNIFGGIALANRIKEVNADATINTANKTVFYYAYSMDSKIIFNNFKPDTRYTFIIKGSGSEKFANLTIRYTDGTMEALGFSAADTVETRVSVSDAAKSVESLLGEWYDGSSTLYYDECGIFEGVLTTTDFKPYPLHTLPIPVEVRGSENLFSPPIKGVSLNPENGSQGSSDTSATTDYIPVHMSGGDYCISGLPNNLWYFVAFYDSNKNFINRTGAGPNVSTYESLVDLAGEANVDPSRVSYIRITMYENSNTSGSITSIDNLKLMMNRGTTPVSYEPYSTVKGLEGYGLGVSDTVYNYIDWEKKQFVKRCASVDLGTLPWHTTQSGNNTYVTSVSGMQNAKTDEERRQGWICEKYNASIVVDNTKLDNKSAIRYDSDRSFYIRDDDYTDAETFKAAMSGVMLVYELATPEVTDISDLITEDNFIGVDGNGTLTFKNAYEYSVPSEVEYQLEV